MKGMLYALLAVSILIGLATIQEAIADDGMCDDYRAIAAHIMEQRQG